MIKPSNKPPLDPGALKKIVQLQFDKVIKRKDSMGQKIKQQIYSPIYIPYHKKQSIDNVMDNGKILIRDHSGARLFKPRFSQSPTKPTRSNSLNNHQISKFATNYKMKILSKQPEAQQVNPERTPSSSMISSNITFKQSMNKGLQKHILHKSPVGKYQNKIKTKRLQFNSDRQISIEKSIQKQKQKQKQKHKQKLKQRQKQKQKQRQLISTDESSIQLKLIKPKASTYFVNCNSPSTKIIAFKRKQSIKKLSIDDFIKGKKLGKGYFGQVFIVKHKQSGFVCAMKTISKQLIRKQRIQDQIIRQLKISLYVSHPNIVQTYGYLFDQNNLYILQQLMTQQELYKNMKRKRVLSEQQTSSIINQLLSGLQYLHRNYITHRDIKPQNILVEKGVVKFCDFGWAVYDPENFRTSYIGTLLYLSPQNVEGKGYDRRNDIWAMGILTYEMLVGNVPFTIWSQNQRNKILYEQIKFPTYYQISQTAKDFILRMLQKNPNNRASIYQLQSHQFIKNRNIIDELKSFN